MDIPLPYEIIEHELNVKIISITELRAGLGKQVYKINTEKESFILYIWLKPYDGNLTENKIDGIEYLYSDGFELFINNTVMLTKIGIRVPKIICANHNNDGDFDYAIVEYFKGKDINEYRKCGGNIIDISNKISDILAKLKAKTREWYGSALTLVPNKISAPKLVLNVFTEELNIASNLDVNVKSIQIALLALMTEKFNNIVCDEITTYSLIHTEITPPHVFVLDNGEIGLIDIEGLKYFDCEFDWAVLDTMYEAKIKLPQDIDINKLEFYKLCLKVGNLSVSIDYLAHVDSEHPFFKNLKEDSLQYLNNMLIQ